MHKGQYMDREERPFGKVRLPEKCRHGVRVQEWCQKCDPLGEDDDERELPNYKTR